MSLHKTTFIFKPLFHKYFDQYMISFYWYIVHVYKRNSVSVSVWEANRIMVGHVNGDIAMDTVKKSDSGQNAKRPSVNILLFLSIIEVPYDRVMTSEVCLTYDHHLQFLIDII